MKMTPYRKNLLAWALIFVLAMSMAAAAQYLSKWFVVLFFLVIFMAHRILNRITCPNCGTPVTHVGKGALGGFHTLAAFYRTKCEKCGWDLNKSS